MTGDYTYDAFNRYRGTLGGSYASVPENVGQSFKAWVTNAPEVSPSARPLESNVQYFSQNNTLGMSDVPVPSLATQTYVEPGSTTASDTTLNLFSPPTAPVANIGIPYARAGGGRKKNKYRNKNTRRQQSRGRSKNAVSPGVS